MQDILSSLRCDDLPEQKFYGTQLLKGLFLYGLTVIHESGGEGAKIGKFEGTKFEYEQFGARDVEACDSLSNRRRQSRHGEQGELMTALDKPTVDALVVSGNRSRVAIIRIRNKHRTCFKTYTGSIPFLFYLIMRYWSIELFFH